MSICAFVSGNDIVNQWPNVYADMFKGKIFVTLSASYEPDQSHSPVNCTGPTFVDICHQKQIFPWSKKIQRRAEDKWAREFEHKQFSPGEKEENRNS